MAGKKVPERRSGLRPSEKELPERRSGTFSHKNTPGCNIPMEKQKIVMTKKSVSRNPLTVIADSLSRAQQTECGEKGRKVTTWK
jgi:hypothetical protein